MISFWWVRHAPVIGNNDRCYGNNDVDCDISDKKAFKNLALNLPKNADVYSSHLTRTIKTLKAAKEQGCIFKNHTMDRRLAEQDLGDYTGMPYHKLYELMNQKKITDKNWLMAINHIPPNGESFKNVCERVQSFIDEVLLSCKYKNLVIFSHGGPIRAAISYVLDYNLKKVIPIEIENTKLTLINYSDKRDGKLIFINK